MAKKPAKRAGKAGKSAGKMPMSKAAMQKHMAKRKGKGC
jgi:hypothetical protein